MRKEAETRGAEDRGSKREADRQGQGLNRRQEQPRGLKEHQNRCRSNQRGDDALDQDFTLRIGLRVRGDGRNVELIEHKDQRDGEN